jgi:hypothetical protein
MKRHVVFAAAAATNVLDWSTIVITNPNTKGRPVYEKWGRVVKGAGIKVERRSLGGCRSV